MSSPSPQDVEDAFLFHLLATEPERVLPAGKSLLSLISHPPVSKPAPPNGIQSQVEKVMHGAFWDEAQQTLSSPKPSVQIPRLRLLYLDLLPPLQPLFPVSHPIITQLAAPVPPTSSPLHSAVTFLDEILQALRKRCAPIRDPDIDHLLEPLQSVSPVHTLGDHEKPDMALASLVVDTIRAIVSLADILKDDLSNAVLAGMSERQLTEYARQQARLKEREVILNWTAWDSNPDGTSSSDMLEFLQSSWAHWANSGPHWVQRFMSSLASSTPVSCMPGDTNSNQLPPQFFFLRPHMFYIQNQMQALVIVASLLTLLKSSARTKQPVIPDFMTRIWSLLKLEINQETTSEHPEETDTKLINLADEMVRAQRMGSESSSEAEEKKIRSAVERTLQLEDPVFRLLQRRLTHFLEERLAALYTGDGLAKGSNNIPKVMRTGRNYPNTTPSQQLPSSNLQVNDILIKGYEDDLLRENIADTLHRIVRCVEWLKYTWDDVISIE